MLKVYSSGGSNMVNQNRTAPVREQSGSDDTEPVDLSEDLVCGLLVGPGNATERVQHQGQDYYFCSPRCAEKFQNDPSTYLKPARDDVDSAFVMPDWGANDDSACGPV